MRIRKHCSNFHLVPSLVDARSATSQINPKITLESVDISSGLLRTAFIQI